MSEWCVCLSARTVLLVVAGAAGGAAMLAMSTIVRRVMRLRD